MNTHSLEILIDQDDINKKVSELGARISRDYYDREIFLLGILKGAVIFLADLARKIRVPAIMDFMAVSSYGSATQSSGAVQIIKDVGISLEGKHVLIVEDIVDTGLTLKYLLENLRAREPASIKICTFLDKPEARIVDVPIDYKGFEIPNKFAVGYGLDFDQKYRNLPYVATLRTE